MSENGRSRRVVLRTASGFAVSLSLAGCVGEDGPEANDGSEPNDDTEGSNGDETDAGDGEGDEGAPESDELPPGLTESGVDLDVLRDAVDDVILEADFRSHAESTQIDGDGVESQARFVGGDSAAELGSEVLVRNADERTHGVVDSDADDPSNATLSNLFAADSWIHWVIADGEKVRNGSDRESETLGEETYRTFVEHTVSGYADEIFSTLAMFEYDAPEWDADRGVYRSAASIPDDAEGDPEVRRGGLWVTADGLPVFAGGRIIERGDEFDAFVTLDPESDPIERPDWVDEASEN